MNTINKNEVFDIVKNLMESDKIKDKSGLSYLIGVNKEVDKYLMNHEKTPQLMKDKILNNKMQDANSLLEANKKMLNSKGKTIIENEIPIKDYINLESAIILKDEVVKQQEIQTKEFNAMDSYINLESAIMIKDEVIKQKEEQAKQRIIKDNKDVTFIGRIKDVYNNTINSLADVGLNDYKGSEAKIEENLNTFKGAFEQIQELGLDELDSLSTQSEQAKLVRKQKQNPISEKLQKYNEQLDKIIDKYIEVNKKEEVFDTTEEQLAFNKEREKVGMLMMEAMKLNYQAANNVNEIKDHHGFMNYMEDKFIDRIQYIKDDALRFKLFEEFELLRNNYAKQNGIDDNNRTNNNSQTKDFLDQKDKFVASQVAIDVDLSLSSFVF